MEDGSRRTASSGDDSNVTGQTTGPDYPSPETTYPETAPLAPEPAETPNQESGSAEETPTDSGDSNRL